MLAKHGQDWPSIVEIDEDDLLDRIGSSWKLKFYEVLMSFASISLAGVPWCNAEPRRSKVDAIPERPTSQDPTICAGITCFGSAEVVQNKNVPCHTNIFEVYLTYCTFDMDMQISSRSFKIKTQNHSRNPVQDFLRPALQTRFAAMYDQLQKALRSDGLASRQKLRGRRSWRFFETVGTVGMCKIAVTSKFYIVLVLLRSKRVPVVCFSVVFFL